MKSILSAYRKEINNDEQSFNDDFGGEFYAIFIYCHYSLNFDNEGIQGLNTINKTHRFIV